MKARSVLLHLFLAIPARAQTPLTERDLDNLVALHAPVRPQAPTTPLPRQASLATRPRAAVKRLDACVGFRYWVFASGLTDVEVLIKVTDTHTHHVRQYFNPQSKPSRPSRTRTLSPPAGKAQERGWPAAKKVGRSAPRKKSAPQNFALGAPESNLLETDELDSSLPEINLAALEFKEVRKNDTRRTEIDFDPIGTQSIGPKSNGSNRLESVAPFSSLLEPKSLRVLRI